MRAPAMPWVMGSIFLPGRNSLHERFRWSDDFDERGSLAHDAADLSREDMVAFERSAKGRGGFGCDGDEKAAGGLRVKEESAEVFGHGSGKFDAAFEEFAIVFQSACKEAASRGFECAGEERNFGVVQTQRHLAARSHLAGVPENAEARDVGDGVNRRGAFRGRLDFVERFGGFAIEARHRSERGFDRARRRLPCFKRRGDDAGADGFGEEESVARLRSDVAPDVLGMDYTSDGVSEFQIVVADGVAADDRAMRLVHFGKAAAKDLL